MAHACSAFAVALFVTVWLLVRERWSIRGFVALGASAALMTMVREQDAFYVIAVALDGVWALASGLRRDGRAIAKWLESAVAGSVAFGVCFLPQVFAYQVLNGRPGPATVISAKMRWAAPHALQVLLSPEHGLFIWTPLALLSVAGLLLRIATPGAETGRPASTRRFVIGLLIMFLAQVYVSGSVDTWTVAGSFGQRRFVGTTVLLVTGLAALLHGAARWRRIVVGGAIALSVWWNLGLMAQFGAGMMDRQRLQIAHNAYNTFVVVPRELPSLAYRYLFNRASFYRPPQR